MSWVPEVAPGAASWRRAAPWCVAAAGLCLPILAYDLRLPDEPRVAHTSLEMLRTGDWVVPTVNGKPFLQTPPLYSWSLAGWLALVGPGHDGLVRVPSILFSLGALAAAWHLARRAAGAGAAPLTVLLLSGTLGFWDAGHRVVVDAALACFVGWGLVVIAGAIAERRLTARRGALLGVCAGLSYLTKGLPGPVILSLAAAYGLSRCQVGGGRRIAAFVAAALLVFAVVGAPWTMALAARRPGDAVELLLGHVGRRFLEGEHHDPDNWAFLHRVLLKLCPWVPATLFGIWLVVRTRPPASGAPPELDRQQGGLLALAFLAPLALLLVSRSKRTLYLLPLLPAAAALAAVGLGPWLARPVAGRRVRRLAWACALLVPVGGTIYNARFDRDGSFTAPGRAAREVESAGATVVGYRLEEREEAALGWSLRHAFEHLGDGPALASRLRELGPRAAVVGETGDLREALGGAGGLEEGRRLLAEERLRRRTIQVWGPR